MRPLAGRRHLALLDALVERRLAGLAGHDLVPGDEAFAVEDVVEAALGLAVGAVAAGAVGLEDGPGLLGRGLVGWRVCPGPLAGQAAAKAQRAKRNTGDG